VIRYLVCFIADFRVVITPVAFISLLLHDCYLVSFSTCNVYHFCLVVYRHRYYGSFNTGSAYPALVKVVLRFSQPIDKSRLFSRLKGKYVL